MSENLQTYLQDHLAGAEFATSLLTDLAGQTADHGLAAFSRDLLTEIESDKQVVEVLLSRLGSERSVLKEASAWITQKISRAKLQLGSDRFSIFEALEILSLGILGKMALWRVLEKIATETELQGIDLPGLISRAISQHEGVEQWRLDYANALTATC